MCSCHFEILRTFTKHQLLVSSETYARCCDHQPDRGESIQASLAQIPPICLKTQILGASKQTPYSWRTLLIFLASLKFEASKAKPGIWTKHQSPHLPLSSVGNGFTLCQVGGSCPLTSRRERERERESESDGEFKVAHSRGKNFSSQLSKAKTRLRRVIIPSTSRDQHGWDPTASVNCIGLPCEVGNLVFWNQCKDSFFDRREGPP